MSTVFIIHGIYGHTKENWLPWLKKELIKKGYSVIIPQFPKTKHQHLSDWIKVLDKHKNYIKDDVIFIGHSLGGAFILNILQAKKAAKTILVACVTGPLKNIFDPFMKDITHRKFDFKKIRENCKRIHLVASDNDPYVPIKKSLTLAKKLKITPVILKNAGHINSSSGYKKLPLILKHFKNVKPIKKGSRKTKKS